MIKGTGVLLLALLYCITASGFALNLHYCGGKVAAVKINAPAKSCIKPMAKPKMKCCKDAKLDVKVKDSHESQSLSFISKVFAIDLPRTLFDDLLFNVRTASLEKSFDRGPPDALLQTVPVFIKNCVFRI